MKTTTTLLLVSLGLLAGWSWGDEVRRRRSAEAKVDDLGRRLEEASLRTPPPEAQLKKIAAVLNDAHKHIVGVSKGLQKPAR